MRGQWSAQSKTVESVWPDFRTMLNVFNRNPANTDAHAVAIDDDDDEEGTEADNDDYIELLGDDEERNVQGDDVADEGSVNDGRNQAHDDDEEKPRADDVVAQAAGVKEHDDAPGPEATAGGKQPQARTTTTKASQTATMAIKQKTRWLALHVTVNLVQHCCQRQRLPLYQTRCLKCEENERHWLQIDKPHKSGTKMFLT
ncbi:TPA: hypothetical protein N0F65_011124 [Lagenidium giganteum]|uniref:Uncharacterized protein n=1 Tax=Lagenidium giganteum TaxID=4803 RepID=A0AAV2ZED0_9STRA|nr:TPA: hypothetical protein N0F65_011124 [Lagenidium giganteum]